MDPINDVKFITKLRSIISGMLFILCIGSYYSYGNINDVIYNYLKNNGNPQIKPQDCLIVQPIWLITQSISTALGMVLAGKIGFRAVNCIGFMSFALLNLILSYTTNYYALIYTYGVFGGVTCGLGYLMGIYIAWTYFPDKKGLVTGMILFSAGISASILSPMTTYIVNPNNNLKPSDEEMYSRVPRMFRILSLYFGTLVLLAAIIQPAPLESKDLKSKINLNNRKNASDTADTYQSMA